MRMTNGLLTTKDRVGNLLENNPELRDSDKLLWLAYLNQEHGLKDLIGLDAYYKLKELVMDDNTPTMESIRRVRQKYQEEGFYLGESRKERMQEAEEVRVWARNNKVPENELSKIDVKKFIDVKPKYNPLVYEDDSFG